MIYYAELVGPGEAVIWAGYLAQKSEAERVDGRIFGRSRPSGWEWRFRPVDEADLSDADRYRVEIQRFRIRTGREPNRAERIQIWRDLVGPERPAR